MELAEVTTLYATNYHHIPDMLRKLAETIEIDSEPTETVIAIQLQDNGELSIYGWGEYDDNKVIALLEKAKFKLLKD